MLKCRLKQKKIPAVNKMNSFKVLCLCIIISGYEIASKSVKLSCRDIRKLVDGHNIRRLMLANGTVPGQPPAKHMNYIVWDKELATKAANWAALAKYPAHNPDNKITSKRFRVGENMFWFMTTNRNYILKMETPLTSWWNEFDDYNYSASLKNRQLQKTGHYTQMAWSNSTHLGCGVDRSKKGKYYVHYIVCNYGPGGNIRSQRPYKSGAASKKLHCESKSKCKQIYGPDCSRKAALL